MDKPSLSPYFLPLELGALWNIMFGCVGVFLLPLHVEVFYTSETPVAAVITSSIFWVAVVLAGLGYGIVGFFNHKFRFFVSIGAAGKIIFFLYVLHLWSGGAISRLGMSIAAGDLLWGVYFLFFLYRTREYGYF